MLENKRRIWTFPYETHLSTHCLVSMHVAHILKLPLTPIILIRILCDTHHPHLPTLGCLPNREKSCNLRICGGIVLEQGRQLRYSSNESE